MKRKQHGYTRTPTHNTWTDMKQRCFNPNNHAFKYYGGRGITVCERWLSFLDFLADMGERPPGKTIDRIDPNGNYEPGNCRWVTQQEQLLNLRCVRKVVIDGVEHVAAELARKSGLKTDTIVERAAQGLSFAEVVSTERRVFTAGLALGGRANGARKRSATHCKNGHPFDEANTFVTPQGWRKCRACCAARQRGYSKAKTVS